MQIDLTLEFQFLVDMYYFFTMEKLELCSGFNATMKKINLKFGTKSVSEMVNRFENLILQNQEKQKSVTISSNLDRRKYTPIFF